MIFRDCEDGGARHAVQERGIERLRYDLVVADEKEVGRTGLLHVACATGELVSLAASGGPPTRTVVLDDDGRITDAVIVPPTSQRNTSTGYWGYMDQESVDMFLDEARIVAGIRHQHVVPVLEVGASEHGYYLVMEYIQGKSLRDVIADGP